MVQQRQRRCEVSNRGISILYQLTISLGIPTVARLSTMRSTTPHLALSGDVGRRTPQKQLSGQGVALFALRMAIESKRRDAEYHA
jgi:hypothetical protein